MPLSNHIEALHTKHEFLDHLISEEMHRPCPDFMVLTDLKKRKLQIKQELQSLEMSLPKAGSA